MSQVKKLARLGSDTRKLAALLQAKAPKGEMLAYISPQEAALLRARGGSGKPHADTGIPSYQIESDFSEGYMADMGRSSFEPQGSALYLEGGPAADYQMGYPEPTFAQPTISGGIPPTAAPQAPGIFPDYTGGVAARPEFAQTGLVPPVEMTGTPPPSYVPPSTMQDVFGAQPSALGRLGSALGVDKMDPTKLGIAGIQALIGGRQARAAARQGQAGKAEMQAVAAPYRAQGQQLQAQAARGELTPVAQQSLQAVQAQLAQGAQARGGVGAAQAAAQVEAVRQQLLQAQADYGLKLSGIGDQIALGAIRAGIQADQYVNNLTNSYMGNIMRLYGGVQPAATGAKQ